VAVLSREKIPRDLGGKLRGGIIRKKGFVLGEKRSYLAERKTARNQGERKARLPKGLNKKGRGK